MRSNQVKKCGSESNGLFSNSATKKLARGLKKLDYNLGRPSRCDVGKLRWVVGFFGKLWGFLKHCEWWLSV